MSDNEELVSRLFDLSGLVHLEVKNLSQTEINGMCLSLFWDKNYFKIINPFGTDCGDGTCKQLLYC